MDWSDRPGIGLLYILVWGTKENVSAIKHTSVPDQEVQTALVSEMNFETHRLEELNIRIMVEISLPITRRSGAFGKSIVTSVVEISTSRDSEPINV